MKKNLNQSPITNELRGASAYFRPPADAPAPEGPVSDDVALTGQPADRSVSQSTSQSIDQPTDPFTAEAAVPPSQVFDTSPILGRPKAFYLTEQQDKDLDTLVAKLTDRLRGRGNQKIDRSTVIRLLLEASDLTTDQTIDRLANQLVSRLVSQLTS